MLKKSNVGYDELSWVDEKNFPGGKTYFSLVFKNVKINLSVLKLKRPLHFFWKNGLCGRHILVDV